jgi:hypothetical protein
MTVFKTNRLEKSFIMFHILGALSEPRLRYCSSNPTLLAKFPPKPREFEVNSVCTVPGMTLSFAFV